MTTSITKTKDPKVLKLKSKPATLGQIWSAKCKAMVEAGAEAKQGLAISTLKDSEKYVIILPTDCQRYVKVIKQSVGLKAFKDKVNEEGETAYTKMRRKGIYLPFRDFYKGAEGDAVICYATGKQIKKDKAVLANNEAVVCMTYGNFLAFYGPGGVLNKDKEFMSLLNKTYKSTEQKRLTLVSKVIELFADYINIKIKLDLAA